MGFALFRRPPDPPHLDVSHAGKRFRVAHGAKLPFRGVPHRIVHWSAIRGVTSATLDPYGEPVIAVTGEPAHVARRVREFLEREARRDLAEAVIRHTAALGVPARRLTV